MASCKYCQPGKQCIAHKFSFEAAYSDRWCRPAATTFEKKALNKWLKKTRAK